MLMEQQFPHALRLLQQYLLDASRELRVSIRFGLIGGLAVSAWGVIRATEDIDLLADSSPTPLRNLTLRDNLQAFLEKNGCTIEWRVGDVEDPIPLLLRVTMPRPAHNVRADILWAHKRWQKEALARTVTLRVSDIEVFVLHPEDLILLKLEAGGPRDLLDVEELLSNPPKELNLQQLRKKSVQLRLGAVLEKCLRGSRGNA